MTCASCAARIERRLSRLGEVSRDGQLRHRDRAGEVPRRRGRRRGPDRSGRAGRLHRSPGGPAEARRRPRSRSAPRQMARLRRRLLVSLALAVPVVALAMVPAWQFRNWQWVSLALASPVALWGAWPFHRAAAAGARHGAATMDTLISVRVGSAYLWSLYVLLFGAAGRAGAADELRLARAGQRRGCHVPGGCGGGDGAGSARPLPRGPGQAALGGGAAGAAVAGGQGRRRAARRRRGPGAGGAARRGRGVRRPARGEDRRRRGRRVAAVRRWTPRC